MGLLRCRAEGSATRQKVTKKVPHPPILLLVGHTGCSRRCCDFKMCIRDRPDTMKNVAATSGQRVSFAVRLVGEIARVGNWAGRDIVLNLLSRPPCQRPSRSSPEHSARVRRTQNTGIRGRCKRYLHSSENFCPAQVLSNAFSADYYCGVPVSYTHLDVYKRQLPLENLRAPVRSA